MTSICKDVSLVQVRVLDCHSQISTPSWVFLFVDILALQRRSRPIEWSETKKHFQTLLQLIRTLGSSGKDLRDSSGGVA